MKTDRIRNDHNALLEQVGALRGLIQVGIPDNAEAIFRQLMHISAAIKLHLSVEDRTLYPALSSAADAHIAATGKRFQDEMGGLAGAYTQFASHWNVAHKIAQQPEEFRQHANAIFKALHDRIQCENNELLPMAETI